MIKLERKDGTFEITKEQFRNLMLNAKKEMERRNRLMKTEIGRNVLKSEGILKD